MNNVLDCFRFLPPVDPNGTQQITVKNVKTETSVCYTVKSGANGRVIQPDLSSLLGKKVSLFWSLFQTRMPPTQTQIGWCGAFKSVVVQWTGELQRAQATLTQVSSELRAGDCKARSFEAVLRHCNLLEIMVDLQNLWNKENGIIRALCDTDSSLADAECMAPFKRAVEEIEELFLKSVGCVAVIMRLDPIDQYAQELLGRVPGNISVEERDWARFQQRRVALLPVIRDPILRHENYQSETIGRLQAVVQHKESPYLDIEKLGTDLMQSSYVQEIYSEINRLEADFAAGRIDAKNQVAAGFSIRTFKEQVVNLCVKLRAIQEQYERSAGFSSTTLEVLASELRKKDIQLQGYLTATATR